MAMQVDICPECGLRKPEYTPQPSEMYQSDRVGCFCLMSGRADPRRGADPECHFCFGRGVLPVDLAAHLFQFLHDHLADIAVLAPSYLVDANPTHVIGQPLEVALAASPAGIYTNDTPLRIYIVPARRVATGDLVENVYDVWFQGKHEVIGATIGRLMALHLNKLENLTYWSKSLLRHLPPTIWHPLPGVPRA